MTKKDYQDLAYILHLGKSTFKSAKKMREHIEIICGWLQCRNERFDRTHFIEAVYNPEYWDFKPDTKAKQQSFFEGS